MQKVKPLSQELENREKKELQRKLWFLMVAYNAGLEQKPHLLMLLGHKSNLQNI